MRLPEFIAAHPEAILREWEIVARRLSPPGRQAVAERERQQAGETLRRIGRALSSPPPPDEKSGTLAGERVHGWGTEKRPPPPATATHGRDRTTFGHDLSVLMAEYCALRASVARLWIASRPVGDEQDLEDLARFHALIDDALTTAIRSHASDLNESREYFLSVLGHDLRGPLNAIVVSTEALQELACPDPAWQALAAQILASAEAMENLLRDFLDFARTRTGCRIPVTPAPMDLGTLCQAVVNEVNAAHPRHVLHLTCEGDLRGVWDADRLRQLLSNLVSNAIQHGGAGTVTITAQGEAETVRLSVHNEGAPLPPAILRRIFDPLAQPRSPGTPPGRSGGLGLGLFIAREIVAAHGGTITVSSSAAHGTTFTVSLPRRTML